MLRCELGEPVFAFVIEYAKRVFPLLRGEETCRVRERDPPALANRKSLQR